MIKKIGLLFLNVGIALIMIILYTDYVCEKSMESLYPVLAYAGEEKIAADLAEKSLESFFPLLVYETSDAVMARREDSFALKNIKPVELLTMMELENEGDAALWEETAADGKESQKDENGIDNTENGVVQTMETTQEETSSSELTQEVVETSFVPHTLQNKVDLQTLTDYESLVQSFYTIDACAMVGSNLLNANELAAVDLRVTKNTEEPQILIYHTHSQEGYIDSVPGDDSTTIMGVGEHLAEILREDYGYQVLHHMGKYDEETRDNAYSRALPEIMQILEEYPSIEVIIDLHRDAVDDDYKLVMDLDGKPTARFMFFNGVSCTKNTGSISYLENPYQLENLAFSFQMKKVAEEYYPGLTRKNYIHGYRYNMHLLPRTTLIELGAQNNTLEEAMNACYPIAHILDMVLTGA